MLECAVFRCGQPTLYETLSVCVNPSVGSFFRRSIDIWSICPWWSSWEVQKCHYACLYVWVCVGWASVWMGVGRQPRGFLPNYVHWLCVLFDVKRHRKKEEQNSLLYIFYGKGGSCSPGVALSKGSEILGRSSIIYYHQMVNIASEQKDLSTLSKKPRAYHYYCFLKVIKTNKSVWKISHELKISILTYVNEYLCEFMS